MSDGLEEWRRWQDFIETTESSPDQIAYRAWKVIATNRARRGHCPSCNEYYEEQVFFDEDTGQFKACTTCTTYSSD